MPPHPAPAPTIPADYASKLQPRLRQAFPECSDAGLDRRMGATLEFLRSCTEPDAPWLAPCASVDVVWHEMIMYTADYRRFCRSLGVAFIDHEPLEPGRSDAPTVAETVAFMEARGLMSDDTAELWADRSEASCCGGHVAL